MPNPLSHSGQGGHPFVDRSLDFTALTESMYHRAVLSIKLVLKPWLAWLRGLSAGLRTKGPSGSIPSQDTRLGCGLGPQVGARERQSISVSLSLSFSLLLSLKINKILKKELVLKSQLTLFIKAGLPSV